MSGKTIIKRCWISRDTKRNGSSDYISIWDRKPILQEIGVFCGYLRLKGDKRPLIRNIGNITIEGQKVIGYGQTKKVKIIMVKE